jgi:type IV secretion system protein VirD4
MAPGIWGRNGGVYLGYESETTEGQPPPLDDGRLLRYVGDRHIITVGPNGSGKTRRLLLPNLADLTDWSVLVVDPKGELAHMTGTHRRQRGNNIVVLNPFGEFGIPSDGFNPIAALDPGSQDFPDDAMGLAEALIRVEGKEPHFSQSAQDLVCALIMYARIVLVDASLADVRAMLGQDSATLRAMVTQRLVKYRGRDVYGVIAAGIRAGCPELEFKAARFSDLGPENRELQSVVSTALTQTRWLDSRPIKADLSKPSIDFGVMKQEPTSVYLILPARRLGTHSTWLRLMIASILQPLLKDTRASSVPVLLMLDEFAQLGHLPVIEQSLALMRGYGLKLWAVFQDFAQARSIYEERWLSFVGNTGVLQAFAPQDHQTAKDLSEAMGQKTAHPIAASGSGPSPDLSIGQIAVPFMLPQELRNMDEGFSMILSHKLKAPASAYMPYPTALPYMQAICALDPSRPVR